MNTFLLILSDTVIDTLKIIPFLFLTYLFLEWMEHQTGSRMERFLERHQKLGPVAGAIFGLVPECGFSSAASSLYATGIISVGTLIAVYLSTSDEMLPIMISQQAGWNRIWPFLLVKVTVALTAGTLIDLWHPKKKSDIESFCQRENCDCEHGILHSALIHTLKIAFWLLLVTLLMNSFVDLLGMDTIKAFVSAHPAYALLTSTLTGMIPSCASSIILTQLYLDAIIPFHAAAAGLLANAGVGMMVLFRVNRNLKNNLKIIGTVWVISFAAGWILSLF
jgi:hypothetical protein